MDNPGVAAMEGVLAIDHVGVATADLDATIAFYRDTLGLVEVHREQNLDQQVVEVMLAAPTQSDRATSDGPAQVQVLAPLSGSSTVARFVDRSGPGMHHLALRVSDLRAFTARLRARGISPLYPEPRRGRANSKINFVHPRDAGGVLIELVEPAAES